MEQDSQNTPLLCSTCHQVILPSQYFCPNCGAKLLDAPLVTSTLAQVKLFAHSVVIPMLAFITIGRWQGIKYLQSKDAKTRTIGIVACCLLVFSTTVTIWLTIVTAQKVMKESTARINAELDGF